MRNRLNYEKLEQYRCIVFIGTVNALREISGIHKQETGGNR